MAKKRLAGIDCLVGLYNHLNYQKKLLTLYCQDLALSLAKVEESMQHNKIKKQQDDKLITKGAVEINLDQVEELIQKAQRVFVTDDLSTSHISSDRINLTNNTIQKSTSMGKQTKVSENKIISSQSSFNRKSLKSSTTSRSKMPSKHTSSIGTIKSKPKECSKALIHDKEKGKIICTSFVKKIIDKSTSNQIETTAPMKVKGSYQKEFLEKQKELVNLKLKCLKATSDTVLNKEAKEKKEEFVKLLYKRNGDNINKDFLSEYSSDQAKDISDTVIADCQQEINLIEEYSCGLYQVDSSNQCVTQEKLFGIIKMKELQYKKILLNAFKKDCEQSIQTFQQLTALTSGNEVFPVVVIDND